MDALWGIAGNIVAYFLNAFIKNEATKLKYFQSWNQWVGQRQARADQTVELKNNLDLQSSDLDKKREELEKGSKGDDVKVLHKIKALVSKAAPDGADVPDWIKIARAEIGQHEFKGGENPRILEYHAATTLKANEDEIAWCSAFVNWVMMKAGCERTHSAAARSWLGYGPRLIGFKKYAIVVFQRPPNNWSGHVGFAIKDNGSTITVLGGNQGDKVCEKEFRKANILGYYWPKKLG